MAASGFERQLEARRLHERAISLDRQVRHRTALAGAGNPCTVVGSTFYEVPVSWGDRFS